MKIYNESKTEIIENPDLEKGYLRLDTLILNSYPAQEELEEQFHYEYKNYIDAKGRIYGKDRIKIIDRPYQPAREAYDETEEIQIYKLYTQEELLEKQKQDLRNYREEFFKIIDCAVWYDCLTQEEKEEVKQFRKALLDITQTLTKPTIPSCVLERVKENK